MKTKYKPFDLEAAKNGAPVIARNGRRARIVCFDRENDKYPVIALVHDTEYQSEDINSYTKTGRHSVSDPSKYDLLMAPVKNKGWINIYPATENDRTAFVSHAFASRVKADCYATAERIACIEIEWEE